MTWFQQLTGCSEDDLATVRANLSLSGDKLVSAANGRQMLYGRLETPTLQQLRSRTTSLPTTGRLVLAEVVGNVQDLHADRVNKNAVFQVASQFNLLEMVAPSVTPEDGIGCYENDLTQGPACAIACGAGTIYRNYFAEVGGQIGQTAENQIDCLADLGAALGNDDAQLWQMRNGYALATKPGLEKIADQLSMANESQRDQLRRLLRIGIQWNTEVTIGGAAHPVSQAYCSALPVAYSSHSSDLWEPLARLVLEAAYEATLCAGVLNLNNTGCNKLFLTLLGGGAFGNRERWILDAIRRAATIHDNTALDVSIVSYGASKRSVRDFVDGWTVD